MEAIESLFKKGGPLAERQVDVGLVCSSLAELFPKLKERYRNSFGASVKSTIKDDPRFIVTTGRDWTRIGCA